jgi:formylglycine-generating enzyme required for sulfatase activity
MGLWVCWGRWRGGIVMVDFNQEVFNQEERAAALWRVDRFVRQFEPDYRKLATYAAVPIVLTPELVGYLRGQFLPRLGWVAEADLLLSELCRPVGYERYVMDAGVQAVLLGELEAGDPTLVEVIARRLLGYMGYLARTNAYVSDRAQKHQQWAAMLCIAELRGEAIAQIAAEVDYWEGAVVSGRFGVGRSEMVFLEQVLREQMPRMVGNGEYMRLAVRVSAAVRRMEVGDRRLVSDAIELPVVANVAFPPLQEFEFDTVTIEPETIFIQTMGGPTIESLIDPQLAWRDRRFEFETAKLEVVESIVETRRSWNPFAAKKVETRTEIVIRKGKGQAVGYVDRIDDQTSIAMIAIPGGQFLMGAPEEELESSSRERPQHLVTVPEFWMGQSAVTQAQWRVVAGLPQVNVEINADPSRFKGANLPVENVSWDDAIEFCARLSIAMGRNYRLPSEAEWEYACRAGTTGPFSFGETIDAEVANYQAQDEKIGKTNYPGKYGRGRFGEYRKKTTPVGTFPANPFGLYDMHGNVWEWCEDHWHDDYQGAPIDGTAWLTNGSDADAARVLRGGSWISYPRWCRSAYRLYYAAGTRNYGLGFRVVVSALPRISS